MRFNWKGATVDELAKHIANISSAHTQSQIVFYTRKKDTDLVQRIEAAKKLAVAYRLRRRADELFEKLHNEIGDEIANSNPEEDARVDRRQQGRSE